MSDAATCARELLAAATPRPWEVRILDSGDVDVVKDHEHIEWICSVGDEAERAAIADAELIAAAPTLLAELADEVNRLRAEMATIAEAHKPIWVDGPAPVCIECGHEYCPTRAALEAALGVES